MALRRVPREEMSESYRALVEECETIAGDTRFVDVAANAPHITHFYFQQFYQDIFYGGLVSPKIKELARLRLSHLHGCAL